MYLFMFINLNTQFILDQKRANFGKKLTKVHLITIYLIIGFN